MPQPQQNPKQERPDLSKVCVYGGKQADEFVGIRYQDGSLKVYFPSGFSAPVEKKEKEYRKDILNLVSVLSAYSKESNGVDENRLFNKEEVPFPIHAYIHVFNYFLNYGYYVESEPYYKKSSIGKINWSRTIKQIRPQISGEKPNESVVYLDFITKRSNSNENELISQIHKYCVFESYEKIGCLFGYFRPEKPHIPFNAKMFAAILKSKIAKTFNEKHLLLFRNMLDIICYMGLKEDNRKAAFGTTDFEYVWEGLIDKVFGIDTGSKKKYFPHCVWKITDQEESADELERKKTALRPDTIMLSGLNDTEADIFVLDAKYYQYGEKREAKKLPGTGSIIKQIAYAEFIESMRKNKSDNRNNIPNGKIYNAFILPYASNKSKTDYALECFGHAECDWKKGPESYNKIYGILLDVRTIMQRHPENSNSDIQKLARLIMEKSKRI